MVLYLSPSSPLRFHPVNMLGISPAVNQQMHSSHSRCQLGRSRPISTQTAKCLHIETETLQLHSSILNQWPLCQKPVMRRSIAYFDATFSDRCFPVLHLLQTVAGFNLLLNVALLLYLFQTNYYCCFPKHKVDNYLCSTTTSESITAEQQNKNSENN